MCEAFQVPDGYEPGTDVIVWGALRLSQGDLAAGDIAAG